MAQGLPSPVWLLSLLRRRSPLSLPTICASVIFNHIAPPISFCRDFLFHIAHADIFDASLLNNRSPFQYYREGCREPTQMRRWRISQMPIAASRYRLPSGKLMPLSREQTLPARP